MGIGRGEVPPARQLAYLVGLVMVTSFAIYLVTIVWLNPGRTALSFRLGIVVLPVCGSIGLGLTVVDFLGLRFQDKVSISEEGVLFISPSGRAIRFPWDERRYSFSISDLRERPDDFVHGRPGIMLKVVLGRKTAWIDEHTLARVILISQSKGWRIKHFETLKAQGSTRWIERRIIFTPPGW
jgi:hypothetical protein